MAAKETQNLKSFPDLPKIDWDTFISRIRVRCAYGIMPACFAEPHRKQNTMKDKKPMPKPMTKKDKGKEKSGKKGCK